MQDTYHPAQRSQAVCPRCDAVVPAAVANKGVALVAACYRCPHCACAWDELRTPTECRRYYGAA